MALNLGQFKTPVDYLLENTNRMDDIFNRVRAAALEQQKINDMVKYHKSDIGLRGSANARAEELHPYAIQAAKDAHMKNRLQYDPEAQADLLKGLMNMYGWGAPAGNESSPQYPSYIQPAFNRGGGQVDQNGNPYVPDQGDLQNPNGSWNGATMENNPMAQGQVGLSGSPIPSLIQAAQNGDPKAQAILGLYNNITKNKLGQNQMKETPEQKTQRTLFENQKKLEQKVAFEDSKAKIKEARAAKADIEHLRTAIARADRLEQIIKSDPSLFGHYAKNELWENVTKNKNLGTFKDLVGDMIGDLEANLSSKGNMLALKVATQLKPNTKEQQQVALGKIQSMKKKLKERMEASMKLAEEAESISTKKTNEQSPQENIDPLGLFGG